MHRLLWVIILAISPYFAGNGALKAQEQPPQSALIQRGSVPAKVGSGEAVRLAPLADETKIRLTIVALPNRDGLAAYADDINNAQSPNFHRYLSLDELKARFMPRDADVQAIEAWAQQGGLSTVYKWSTNHAIAVQGTVAQVNALLHVSLGRYAIGESTYFANDKAPSIPADLAPRIADILGLDSIQRPRSHASAAPQAVIHLDVPSASTGPFIEVETVQVDADPTKPHGRLAEALRPQISGPLNSPIYEPEDIWSSQAYNFNALAKFTRCCNPNGLAAGAPIETSIAVIGNDKPDPNDLQGFFRTFNLASSISITSVGGPLCCDLEMTMDAEWAGAMANSFGSFKDTAPIHIYTSDNNGPAGLLNAWESALSDNRTRVATSSYSNIESDFGGLFKPSISDFTDVTRAMTAMGWTLVAATGDQGGDASCDERGSVMYPATDPNVVATGGTTLNLNNPLSFASETAWSGNSCGPGGRANAGGGGGGCSNDTFPANPWNRGACTGNRRAIPDMSLNAGAGQAVYYSYSGCPNKICSIGGTSIAAPELAGFFAQENSYLLHLGNLCGPNRDTHCAPLGRAAPILFAAVSQPHDPFYDTLGGCTTNGQSSGYCAARGYDLATGLGSANMLQLAWAINYNLLDNGSTPPIVRFSGAQPGTLYSSDVTVDFTFDAANRGVAGYTARLDSDPGDPRSHASPGSGDPFWDGPQVINASGGSMHIPYAAGCHTVFVRAWDNLGNSSAEGGYGPICMGKGMQCTFSESGCPAEGGEEEYNLSCPQVMNFYVFGKFVSTGKSATGQNQPEHEYTNLRACIPGTTNCQDYSFASTQSCPIHPVNPPIHVPPLKNCSSCQDTGRQCVKIPGGFQCKGIAR